LSLDTLLVNKITQENPEIYSLGLHYSSQRLLKDEDLEEHGDSLQFEKEQNQFALNLERNRKLRH